MSTASDSKFRSRKFLIAVFYTLASTIALFTGHMSDAQYVILAGAIVGLYGYTNAKAKESYKAD